MSKHEYLSTVATVTQAYTDKKQRSIALRNLRRIYRPQEDYYRVCRRYGLVR